MGKEPYFAGGAFLQLSWLFKGGILGQNNTGRTAHPPFLFVPVRPGEGGKLTKNPVLKGLSPLGNVEQPEWRLAQGFLDFHAVFARRQLHESRMSAGGLTIILQKRFYGKCITILQDLRIKGMRLLR